MPAATSRPRRVPKLNALAAFVVAACCLVSYDSDAFLQLAGLRAAGGELVNGLRPARSASSSSTAMRVFKTMAIQEPPEDQMSAKMWKYVPTAEHMEYAVVEIRMHQHMVVEGGLYETKFIRAVPGAKVHFNRVLLLKRRHSETDEMQVLIGQPYVNGATIEVTILEHFKAPDFEHFFFKAKKRQMKRYITNDKVTRFRVDRIIPEGPTDIQGIGSMPLNVRQQIPKIPNPPSFDYKRKGAAPVLELASGENAEI